jgi:hypothetical protein
VFGVKNEFIDRKIISLDFLTNMVVKIRGKVDDKLSNFVVRPIKKKAHAHGPTLAGLLA